MPVARGESAFPKGPSTVRSALQRCHSVIRQQGTKGDDSPASLTYFSLLSLVEAALPLPANQGQVPALKFYWPMHTGTQSTLVVAATYSSMEHPLYTLMGLYEEAQWGEDTKMLVP